MEGRNGSFGLTGSVHVRVPNQLLIQHGRLIEKQRSRSAEDALRSGVNLNCNIEALYD